MAIKPVKKGEKPGPMRLMTTLHTVERLREIFGDRLAISEPLSRHTTARVGGPAELFLTAASAEELRLAVEGAYACLLYPSPSPRDRNRSRMPSFA